MKEIVHKYENLWKENRLKKSRWKRVTNGEKGCMWADVVVLILSLFGIYYCEKSNNPSIDWLLLCMMGMLASSFLLIYKLNVISSKVFNREGLRPEDWFYKLKQMLREHGIQSNEEIDYLQRWCTEISNEETLAKVFIESMEKILGIFIIPTVITIMSVYLEGAENMILFYRSILAIVIMIWIGLFVYIVLPLITGKNDDRDIIKYLSRDLLELQIHNEKIENVDCQNEA